MIEINRESATSPLDGVVKQFEQWRATRGKRGPMPDTLRALIKPLETQYSPNEIVKALRINHAQLKNCFGTSNNKSAPQPMTLVECSARITSLLPESQSTTLMFSCKNGKPVTLNGLCGNDIAVVISLLIGG